MIDEKCKLLKKKLVAQCKQVVGNRLTILEGELKHLSEAIAEDTKSSVGDKYETGREMANLEKGKLHTQAHNLKKSLTVLNSLPQASPAKIGLGSLIRTNNEWIYLSVSLGQLEVDGERVLVISPIAPLGQLMMGRKNGETVAFRNNNYQISNIC